MTSRIESLSTDKFTVHPVCVLFIIIIYITLFRLVMTGMITFGTLSVAHYSRTPAGHLRDLAGGGRCQTPAARFSELAAAEAMPPAALEVSR
jgi:hypothetical protein